MAKAAGLADILKDYFKDHKSQWEDIADLSGKEEEEKAKKAAEIITIDGEVEHKTEPYTMVMQKEQILIHTTEGGDYVPVSWERFVNVFFRLYKDIPYANFADFYSVKQDFEH